MYMDAVGKTNIPNCAYSYALTYTINFIDKGCIHQTLSHFWSLPVEEHFYIFWPVVFLLGSVRKEMSRTPHGTSQRDHTGIAFRELFEARHDASVLFQPAKHALDDVALSVLVPIKQPW